MGSESKSRKLVVSVVQACTAAYSLQDTLDKLDRLTRLAKDRDGSQLAVFPEAFIGGYPKGSTFGTVVGSRSAAGREEYLRYHSSAISVSEASPAIQSIENISRDTGVFLAVGVIEKDGGTLYCTVVFVHPQEGLVGKHRKLVPTAAERLVWGNGDGSTLPVLEETFESHDGQQKVTAKMSAAICWENYMPLLRSYYYSQHTELYLAPTVDCRSVWQSTMQHIALEGRCFVLSACQFAQQKDFPPDHPTLPGSARDPEGVMISGGSVIIAPLGEILAGPLLHGEDVLSAEIDLDDCVRGKFDLDVTGHYARTDIFELVTHGIDPTRATV
ncbi:hypothetical protein BOTBODRAFT_59581 [Botryobasidium botryosum FD-172 SS1]|uniref:CN hydrolase domain-containing protein n=1 Tax=Botryobasidium botryosum (strain FD-172 SS1) TaxID=930990 RepID=A0A067LXT3_BOTB1|nr:hypothetical protein BOTBODRAFT_59581 [Botryobasidium botryosum FD-172 SS1]